MAKQLFVPDKAATTGKEPTVHTGLSAADEFQFVNDGKVRIRISNANEADTKVTVVTTAKVDGQEVKNREVEVKKTKTALIGPFDKAKYNNEEEKVTFKISSALGVTVEIEKLP
jgi:hypothetical protein